MPSLAFLPTPASEAKLHRMDEDEVDARLCVMRQQEQTTYSCSDYLADHHEMRMSVSRPVDEDCRVKMCEWCYQVVDFCKFRRETVHIGMTYLDRYLSSPAGHEALMERKTYQLASMTCLYMAIKLNEPLEMETSLLADLSRGCYTDLEIAEMEQSILDALNWRVSGPTTLAFVQHFMALFPECVPSTVGVAILDYARYQTELAVPDYNFVCHSQSSVAFAAILNAMEGVDRSLLPLKSQGAFLRSIERVSGLLKEDVEDIQVYLSDIMLDLVTPGDITSVSSSESKCSSSRSSKSYDLSDTTSKGDTTISSERRSPVCVSRQASR